MKQIFTYNETRVIILIVVLSMLRGMYNLYILHDAKDKKIPCELNSVKILSEKLSDFSFFSIVQFLISVLYLFSSVYFFVNDKIKNVTFALVCLIMFIKASLYFIVRFLGDIPVIPNDVEKKYLYISFSLTNLLMFSVTLYFIKEIFFS